MKITIPYAPLQNPNPTKTTYLWNKFIEVLYLASHLTLGSNAIADWMLLANFSLNEETVFFNILHELISSGSHSSCCRVWSCLSRNLRRLASATLIRLREAFVCINFVTKNPPRICWSAFTSSDMKDGNSILLKISKKSSLSTGSLFPFFTVLDNSASWHWREKMPVR